MAILRNDVIDFVSQSAEQTTRLGHRLGALLQPHDLVCLYGDLGAGKTAFARGVGAGWGTTLRVTSPTFTLVNEYPREDGTILYHLDCYRLESEADAITTGIEDILDANAAIMIEWPERVETFLPSARFNIHLRHVDITRRGLRIEAIGERFQTLLTRYRQVAFGI